MELGALGQSVQIMVMLVDDQHIVAERLRLDLLNEPSIDFHYCQEPEEVIAMAQSVRPTVILLDLIMPNVDGLKLLQELRSHPVTAEIPIIVLSTKEQVDFKARAFEYGANDYLIKMPDKRETIARVIYHSRAYINKLQRDAAFQALRESQRHLEQKNLELMRMSNIDGLTGVNNRRYFDSVLEQVWSRACRSQTPLSLAMIDIDCFKQYNDTYGHLKGDDCLRLVAKALQQQLPRTTDFVARYGGEEFAVVLDITDEKGARLVGQKLFDAIEKLRLEHARSDVAEYVTASIGLASILPDHRFSPEDLIGASDRALYKAKQTGRNRVVHHGMVQLVDAANQAAGNTR